MSGKTTSWMLLPLAIRKVRFGSQSGQVQSAGPVSRSGTRDPPRQALHPISFFPPPLQLLRKINSEWTNSEGDSPLGTSGLEGNSQANAGLRPLRSAPGTWRPGCPHQVALKYGPSHPSADAQHKAWDVSLLKMQASTDVSCVVLSNIHTVLKIEK